MTVNETFSDWYDRMKSAISETIGPGQQKGEQLDSCVRQVMAQGHDRESAYAICNDTLKADLEKSERDELLDTAREMSKYDPQIPLTFGNLVEYAGVDVKGEEELELPKSCRRCSTATRVKGSFMCPDCDSSINKETDEYELVGSGVQEAKGEDEEETEKAAGDDHAGGPTRKVYLTPSTVDEAPADAQVKSDDRGLYYEETVDVDQKAGKKDPCWEGYEMAGTKVVDGEEVPNCVPIDDSKAGLKEEDPCWEGYEMAGTKVVDGEEVPNCVPIDDSKAVPEGAVSIDSRSEAPEGAKVIEGDQGGLYYVPEGEGGGEEGGDLSDVDVDEDGTVQDISQLDEGDEVLLGDEKVTVQYAGADETTGDTLLGYVDEDGEEFFVYEDILGRDVTVPGAAEEGSGDGGVPDDPGGGDGEEAGPDFQEGQEIESPSGEPATVAAYDEDTDVVLYETEDGEEMMAPGDSFRDTEPREVSERQERLSELTGIDNVNVDDLSDEQVDAFETAWADFDEGVGVPEQAVFDLTTNPPDDVGAGAGAAYNLSSRKLYLNPDGLDAESKKKDFEEGFIATETVEGSMFHELAHAKHFSESLSGDGPSMDELQNADLSEEQKAVAEEEVSWYASTSPTELVAEVSSGLYEGREFSDEVMEMYDQLGGHEVNA